MVGSIPLPMAHAEGRFTHEDPDYFARLAEQGHVALVYAGLGRRAEAQREARWLQQSRTYREDAFDGPLLAGDRARILAGIGDVDGALAEIEPDARGDPSLRLVAVGVELDAGTTAPQSPQKRLPCGTSLAQDGHLDITVRQAYTNGGFKSLSR